MPEQSARYRFDRFELLPSERRLLDAGQPAMLGPRAFDLLVTLVHHAGQLVTKDEILKRVWQDLVVDEGNLQVQVSNLRKVLGGDAIETVPGHGYRFTQSVTVDATSGPLARRHNLPRELTSFVGREAEVGEQRRRLSEARLLTITGAGGLGKTRFSLQLAAGVVDDYPDGVWLVELAGVSDAEHVSAAFAAVLRVPAARAGSLRDAVVGYVRDRQLLLVVDNCEHVLRPVAELAKLMLQTAPLVKLVATSREPLHLAGEVLCPLSPLDVPPPDLTLEQALGHPAIQLFVTRAGASRPDFALSRDNVGSIAAICRRLEGIPLAIELAAARTRGVSIAMIADRLDDRFRLLNAGERTAAARHQTLRSAIDWSYDLLTADEREVMNRLSVFAGGFDLEAAEAMSASDDTLDLLGRLVDKSLVIADPDRDRYSLLETVRQYAHDRLVESDAEPAAREAHLAHFLALAEKLEPELIGANQAAAYARLARDRDNFVAAHSWCEHAGNGLHRNLRLVCSLRLFWQVQGPLHQGYHLARQTLSRRSTDARDYTRCQALFTAGMYAYYLGHPGEAQAYGEESAAITRELGDGVKMADVLMLLACNAMAEGDVANARSCVDESLALARAASDDVRVGQALNVQGELHAIAGDLAAAEAAYDESLALVRKAGEYASVAGTLINLARISALRASPAAAADHLRAAAEVIEATGAQHQMQVWLAIASGFASDLGEWKRAAELWGAVGARAKRHGLKLEAADDLFAAPRIDRVREALGEAAFADAQRVGATLSDAQSVAAVRDWLHQWCSH